MSGAIVQIRPTIGMDFETLTISNAAKSLTSSKYVNSAGNATRAFLTLAGGEVRYRYDGSDPTSSVGHVLSSGGFLVIEGQNQMSMIRFIRTGSSDGTASLTYERE